MRTIRRARNVKFRSLSPSRNPRSAPDIGRPPPGDRIGCSLTAVDDGTDFPSRDVRFHGESWRVTGPSPDIVIPALMTPPASAALGSVFAGRGGWGRKASSNNQNKNERPNFKDLS